MMRVKMLRNVRVMRGKGAFEYYAKGAEFSVKEHLADEWQANGDAEIVEPQGSEPVKKEIEEIETDPGPVDVIEENQDETTEA